MSLSSTGHSPRLSKARLCGTPELREMERIVVDSLNGEPTGLPELLPGSGVYLLVEQFFSMKLLRVERGRFRASHVEYWKIDCDSPATLLHGLR